MRIRRHNTIQLTDTHDSYERKLHVNTLGRKVTIVLRWRSRFDNKRHTQRTTIDVNTAMLLANQLMITATLTGQDFK